MYIYLVIFRFLVKIHCVVFILKLINSDYVFVLFQVMASQDFIYYNGVQSHMQKQARKVDHTQLMDQNYNKCKLKVKAI